MLSVAITPIQSNRCFYSPLLPLKGALGRAALSSIIPGVQDSKHNSQYL